MSLAICDQNKYICITKYILWFTISWSKVNTKRTGPEPDPHDRAGGRTDRTVAPVVLRSRLPSYSSPTLQIKHLPPVICHSELPGFSLEGMDETADVVPDLNLVPREADDLVRSLTNRR